MSAATKWHVLGIGLGIGLFLGMAGAASAQNIVVDAFDKISLDATPTSTFNSASQVALKPQLAAL